MIKLFENYNTCKKSSFTTFESKEQRKTKVNLNARLGASFSSLSLNTGIATRDYDFGNKISPRIGSELEIPLNFNNNKWALLAEASYNSFIEEGQIERLTSSTTSRIIDVKSEYAFIEMALGVRHYVYLNKTSKLFVNASYILDFISVNNTIDYGSSGEAQLGKDNVLGFGVGYKYKKFQLELRYQTEKFKNENYDFQTSGLILGYQFF